MNERIFTSLAKNGLIKRGKVNKQKVFDFPFINIIDILDNITQQTSETEDISKSSIHSHCATFGLGGGRDECWYVGCRLNAVNEMARFAALYSDNFSFAENFLKF